MVDDESTDATPDDTMQRRGVESRLKLWLLLETDRWVVAAGIAVVFFAGTLAAAVLLADRVVLTAGDPIETLFQALVTATITGVTLVVSINSLVLSQELGPLGDQRDRIEGSMSFRREVEDELGIDVAAATPAAFLRELVGAIEERSLNLVEAARDTSASGVDTEQIGEYAANVQHHAAAVRAGLEDEQFGTFGVVSAALNFNYSWKINRGRSLRAGLDTGESATEDESRSHRRLREYLDGIVTALTLFGPAREHIKTLYFQWELVELSRAILYTAVPATVVATNVLLFHGALTGLTGTTAGIAHYIWVVAAAVAITLAPFAILLSFILRLGTVAKRTLSIGPFILRSGDTGPEKDG